jgi:small subunit ribosomal protein S5
MGISKGADVAAAITKATNTAKKSLIKLTLYKGTLTHEVEAKKGGAKVLILPAAPGTGLIAGGVMRSILEVAGIENALSKSIGSNNRINVAYATLQALQSMVPAKEWISRRNVNAQKAAKKVAEKSA